MMPADYGSILSSDVGYALGDLVSEAEAIKVADRTTTYDDQLANLDKYMSQYLDGSTRLIGAPHQFLPHNDNRYGSSGLGRNFGENIIMGAPIVHIKPGVAEFLPGENTKERQGFINAMVAYANDDRSALEKKISSNSEDLIQYFGLKPDFSGYMSKVNMLCRMLATMLGINKLRVPWVNMPNVTFGNYDWRQFKMSSQYKNLSYNAPAESKGVFNAFKDFLGNAANALTYDYEFIEFYITPDSSAAESYSNSTTSSVLDTFSGQLEGVAKELQMVSAMTGKDVGQLANSMTSSVDDWISKNTEGGAIGDMLRKITGAANQVIKGGNFVLPEIWSDSSVDTSYSFSLHLVTPYGNKLSWFINIGVPLMYCIALVLPVQQTANVVSAPYFVKAFAPGWFNCSYGIVDSMSIEKASDGTWNKANLPNDVTVRMSIKDMYKTLSLPQSNSPKQFFANTGMLEFLMVTAGVDISRQEIGDKWEIWKALYSNLMTNKIQKIGYDASMLFKHKASGIFKLLS